MIIFDRYERMGIEMEALYEKTMAFDAAIYRDSDTTHSL